ncbi:unnamed protein product [Urochloa decumbens]|uniref:Uncharacterized protein n=1 Tax=Urochloa decumbens TaxID=240449 RepID=A0ABC9AK10_9POAL
MASARRRNAFTERELAQKLMPEMRIINRYAIFRAYILKAIKLVGSLALLWSTVVLLGGFVTLLKKKDFWYLTLIGFIQAAGFFNAFGNREFLALLKQYESLQLKLKRTPSLSIYVNSVIFGFIFLPVAIPAAYGPIGCFILSLDRLRHQDYGSDDGDVNKANLKQALNLFYSVSLAQGGIFMSFIIFEVIFELYMMVFIWRHGFSKDVIDEYKDETVIRCVKDPVSTKNWNLITYGTELLDSELPEDYVSGATALNMLIEREIPIRWFLMRSPRQRIQKLIEALGWRSPVVRETRGLAARIVAHLAADLDLIQFQGALECISSLLDISCQNTADQEVLHLVSGSNESRKWEPLLFKLIRTYHAWKAKKNGTPMQDSKKKEKQRKPISSIGTNEDLILQGLRILENLAHNEYNCTEIYNTKGLLLKITAPFNSDKFIEDIGTSVPWIKVVEASLRVVARLMEAPGETGMNMRRQIAGNRTNSKAIENLEAVLSRQGDSSILELQTHATDVLAQIFSDESTMSSVRVDTFIETVRDIFLADIWMEDYFDTRAKFVNETTSRLVKDKESPSYWEELCPCLLEKRIKALVDQKMKEAQETAMRHKEKAGAALAKLSRGNQNNSEDAIHRLIEMLDWKIETTVECSMSVTEAFKTKIQTKTIRCRISAAEALKNLCVHSMVNNTFKETMLRMILEELLSTNRKLESQAGGISLRNCLRATSNDEENPPSRQSLLQQAQPQSLRANTRREHEENSPSLSRLQHPEERMLQAALLSLYATICETWKKNANNAGDFAKVLMHMVAGKDFVGNLKVVIEENSYATPACLAILKITYEMVKLLMQHDDYLKEIKETKIIDAMSKAAETIAGLESCMLFTGVDHDCYGLPVKPLYSVLVEQARKLL